VHIKSLHIIIIIIYRPVLWRQLIINLSSHLEIQLACTDMTRPPRSHFNL